ncbi:MAG: glycosyltransferase family 4 protein [Chlorobi bacterium]|nr:glycosyltransferase family 4 protein [Chlorobiota bacterium]
MKIGFEAKRAFYNTGGLGNYSRSTIGILSKYYPKHEYLLYTPSTENAIDFKISDNVKIVVPKMFLSKTFKSYWRTVRLSKKIKEYKLDIFHGLSGELPYKAEKKSDAKLIVTIHDLIFLRFPELYHAVDRKIYYQKAKYACEIADTIIAVSEQTKTDIVNFLEVDDNKINVVYQGCNSIYYREADTNKKIEVTQKYNLPETFILNVGTVEKRKNTLSVLKAMKAGNIKTEFVIVGKKTDYQDELIKYAEENNLSSLLTILNNVPIEDLPAIYQQASVFVYPSYFEGFGIPLIEALYSKIPVITTKGGVFSETGGLSSIYIEPDKFKQLGEALNVVLNDEELKEEMVTEGYKFVQKFHEEKIAANLMNVYLK